MEILGIDVTKLIIWVVFGLAVGVAVHLIDPGKVRGGFFGSIIAGIIGAMTGGILASLVLGTGFNVFDIQSLLIAVGGALILVALYRIFFRKTGHIRTQTEKLE